jgi:hypothetical protein
VKTSRFARFFGYRLSALRALSGDFATRRQPQSTDNPTTDNAREDAQIRACFLTWLVPSGLVRRIDLANAMKAG